LKDPSHFPTLPEIRQKALGEKNALIAYFLRGSHYAVITVTKDSLWMDMLPDPGQRILEELRLSLTKSPEQTHSGVMSLDSISGVIYDSLVSKPMAHLDKNITSIHLGLDGLLSLIPYESLKINKGPRSRYLMEQYDISYFTEVSTLTNEPSDRVQKIAIYTPTYQLQMVDTTSDMALAQLVRSGYYELPGAAFESQQIGKLTNGRLFNGNLATETAFRDLAPDYDILHLSMHGIIEDEHPFLSSLLFDQENDLHNDGFLRVGEIHQLDLKARMVVLSACNTGYGQIRQGEGVVSIAQAFQYAGVPTAVMSLWKVPDQSTSVIMQEFYRGLKKGLAKDRALTEAKRHFLNSVSDPNLRHPYYWAGFILQGDTSSLQFAGGLPWEFLLFDFAVIALIVIYGWRRSKVKRPDTQVAGS
jgi:CHAT domain-containing protein